MVSLKDIKGISVAVLTGLLFLPGCAAHKHTGAASSPSGTVSGSASNTDYSIVEKGANFQVWERTEYETTPSGEVRPHVHRYVETQTGLNFWNSATGQWEASSEEIQSIPGGAAALNGQHKVIFATDLATPGAIQLQTPDGLQLSNHLLGLVYADTASGKSVWIAQVTNSIGQLISSNQVWYGNAFSGVNAGVLYTYTRSGFSQDIVLASRPPLPEAWGLNSTSTVLQAITEFLSPPAPVITTNFASGTLALPGDERLDFGRLRFARGSGFFMGSESNGVVVSKQWVNQNGRWFLVEEVPIPEIASQLDTLPTGQTASIKGSRVGDRDSVLNVVSKKRLWPAGPVAKNGSRERRILSYGNGVEMLAQRGKMSVPRSAFVLDYVTLNTSQTNEMFQGDTTYYISGNVNLFGTNSFFEGGTVLKFSSNATLTVNTPVAWQAGPYRPVVMLSKDQNGTGESISGSTGSPGNNYYAATAFYFNGISAATNLTIHNLRVANASVGVTINGQSGHLLDDVQMIKCENGIAATNTDFSLHNALFDNVLTNFAGNNATGRVEQLTSDAAASLNQNMGANLILTNCLLTAVANLGGSITDHVANLSAAAGSIKPRLAAIIISLPTACIKMSARQTSARTPC